MKVNSMSWVKKGRLVMIVQLNGKPTYMNAINSIFPDGRVS